MQHLEFEYIDGVIPEIEQKMHFGHIEDEKQHGVKFNYKKFSIVIKDGQKFVGGLIAYTVYKEIYVDDLWVDPLYRRKGLGCGLLKELESRFAGKGYNNINLVTSAFQAPEFYKKCGFEVEFVRENKENPEFTKTFFVKYLKS